MIYPFDNLLLPVCHPFAFNLRSLIDKIENNQILIFPRILEKLFQGDFAAKKKSNYLRINFPLKRFELPVSFAVRFESVCYSSSHPSAIRSGFSSQGCSLNDFYNLHRYRDLLGLMCNMDHYEDFHGLFDDMEHNRD